MSGSGNPRKRAPWPITSKSAKHLLRDLRSRLGSDSPLDVRDAVVRVESSLSSDTQPSREDLATVLLWVLALHHQVDDEARPVKSAPPKQKPRSSRWSKSHRFGREASARTTQHARQDSSGPPQKTGFSLHIEEQDDALDPMVASLRKRISKSRVRTDPSGRRIIVSGDDPS